MLKPELKLIGIRVILRVSNFLLAQLRIRIEKREPWIGSPTQFLDPAQQWVPNCKTGKQNRELVGKTHFLRNSDAFFA